MKNRSRFLPTALAFILVTTLAATASAQGRQRTVKRIDPTAAVALGRVVDAASQAPVGEALVQIGTRQALTAADGTFAISGLAAQTYGLEVTHWLYQTHSRQITLSTGTNRVDLALQPAPATSVRTKSGSTFSLASPTVQFGYVVSFVGWVSGPQLRICLPAGEEITIQASDMKTVAVPGTRQEATECCSLAAGTIVRVTRRSGEVVEGTIRESCTGSDFYVIGRNRDSGNFENLRLLDVESVTFQ